MPRQATRKQFLNFVGGLHTEASPLTFPENTAKDLDNVDLLRDGSVKRRRGLKLETDYQLSSASFTTANAQLDGITVHEWKSVGGDDTLNFLVIQVGLNLYFHQLGTAITSTASAGSVSLSGLTLNSNARYEPISVASGKDRLFVVSKYTEPCYIEYDSDAGTFSVTELNLKIRDVEGLDDGLDIAERPTSLSTAHRYNLRNQGWNDPSFGDNTILVTTNSSDVSSGNPIEITRSFSGVYPSNSDIMHFAKMSAARSAVAVGAYHPRSLERYNYGNTPAARGRFILDAFDRNRETASGQSGLYNTGRDLDSTRPISVEFYAGRVWYLMQNGRLLYSQVLDDILDAEKCYQEADPTAEDINELVATDGGELEIVGVNRALKLLAVGPDLLLFGNNGVWSVSGAEQSVFSATSQYVSKITYVGALGRDTILPIENFAVYWSDGGIYALTRDQGLGNLVPQNLTETTIQTRYESIGQLAKTYARGKYDRRDKKIYWLYNDSVGYNGTVDRFLYNRILIFDTVLSAFYTYSIVDDAGYPSVSALIEKEAFGFTSSEETVTAGGSTITAGGSNVTVNVVSGSTTTEVKLQAFILGDFLGLLDEWTWEAGVQTGSNLSFGGTGDPYRQSFDFAYWDGISTGESIGDFTFHAVGFETTRWNYDSTGDGSRDQDISGQFLFVVFLDDSGGNYPAQDLFTTVRIETDSGVFTDWDSSDADFFEIDDDAGSFGSMAIWVWTLDAGIPTSQYWFTEDLSQARDVQFFY